MQIKQEQDLEMTASKRTRQRAIRTKVRRSEKKQQLKMQFDIKSPGGALSSFKSKASNNGSSSTSKALSLLGSTKKRGDAAAASKSSRSKKSNKKRRRQPTTTSSSAETQSKKKAKEFKVAIMKEALFKQNIFSIKMKQDRRNSMETKEANDFINKKLEKEDDMKKEVEEMIKTSSSSGGSTSTSSKKTQQEFFENQITKIVERFEAITVNDAENDSLYKTNTSPLHRFLEDFVEFSNKMTHSILPRISKPLTLSSEVPQEVAYQLEERSKLSKNIFNNEVKPRFVKSLSTGILGNLLFNVTKTINIFGNPENEETQKIIRDSQYSKSMIRDINKKFATASDSDKDDTSSKLKFSDLNPSIALFEMFYTLVQSVNHTFEVEYYKPSKKTFLTTDGGNEVVDYESKVSVRLAVFMQRINAIKKVIEKLPEDDKDNPDTNLYLFKYNTIEESKLEIEKLVEKWLEYIKGKLSLYKNINKGLINSRNQKDENEIQYDNEIKFHNELLSSIKSIAGI